MGRIYRINLLNNMKNYINESQDKRISEIEAHAKKYPELYANKTTTKAIAGALLTIILAIFGYTMGAIGNLEQKLETTNTEYTKIQSQLSQIQTDLVWLKQEISKK